MSNLNTFENTNQQDTTIPIQYQENASDSGFSDELEPLISEAPHKGHSSFLSSTFNSINVMTGMGILALPFSFSQSGWILGIILVLSSAIVACFTAKLLGECIDLEYKDRSKQPAKNLNMVTYSDVGERAFGNIGRIFITIMFFLELFAACTALIIVIGDSLTSLFPSFDTTISKAIIVAILTPSLFMKTLNLFTFTSVVGIIATLNVAAIIIFEGAITRETPGSWLNPADTNLWPNSIMSAGMAVGLILVGFDGIFILICSS